MSDREVLDKVRADLLAQPDCWAELKHAIRVYLTLTRGPSEALCVRLLKLPDFIDDERIGKNSDAEMMMLAYELIREIGQGVQAKLHSLRNRPGLVEIHRRLDHCLDWAAGVPQHDAKRAILYDVELSLRTLQEVTGESYPTVPA